MVAEAMETMKDARRTRRLLGAASGRILDRYGRDRWARLNATLDQESEAELQRVARGFPESEITDLVVFLRAMRTLYKCRAQDSDVPWESLLTTIILGAKYDMIELDGKTLPPGTTVAIETDTGGLVERRIPPHGPRGHPVLSLTGWPSGRSQRDREGDSYALYGVRLRAVRKTRAGG